MSKIHFTFSTFPHYFRKHGWLDPKPNGSHMKMIVLLVWMFDRCSSEDRKIFHNNREVHLAPYEFIFGRVKCSEQTGLTEQEIRNRLEWLTTANLLEKATSKTTSKITVYRWRTEAFSDNNNQQTNLKRTSKQPADNQQIPVPYKDKEEEEEEEKKYSSLASSLVEFFSLSLADHVPEFRGRPAVAKDAVHFDKLLSKYSPDEIRKAITWAHTDPFWAPKVTKPSYLKSKFVTLFGAANREGQPAKEITPSKTSRFPTDPEFIKNFIPRY